MWTENIKDEKLAFFENPKTSQIINLRKRIESRHRAQGTITRLLKNTRS